MCVCRRVVQPQATNEEDACEEARDAKATGNGLYKAKKYQEAVEAYSVAISLEPRVYTFYSNRAAAHMMLEHYMEAVADCQHAVEIKPDFHKAFVRMSKAYLAMGKFDLSLEALQRVPGGARKDRDNVLLTRKRYEEASRLVASVRRCDVCGVFGTGALIESQTSRETMRFSS